MRTDLFIVKRCLSILFLVLASIVCSGQIRFSDDFEEGFDPNPSNQVYGQWYTSGWGDGDGLTITSEISPRNGKQCVKSVMNYNTNGRSRSEIGVNLDHSLGEYWYGFSVYIPEEIDLDKVVIGQDWRSVIAQWGVWENNPGLPDFALRLGSEYFTLTYEPGEQIAIPMWETAAEQGKWIDWVFRIHWTRDSDGLIQVWKDGELVFEKFDFQTTDGVGDDVKSKIGLYSAGWGRNPTIYKHIYLYYDSYSVAKGQNNYKVVSPNRE